MPPSRGSADRLSELPETFRYAQARGLAISDRSLQELRKAGRIERLGRGLYRMSTAQEADHDLLEIATKQGSATLCLGTALARHDLSDEIPAWIDVALPRDTWRPTTRTPVRWHSFARDTFDIGRDTHRIDSSTAIGIYSPERSIIDAIRLRHLDGSEQAYEALRRWLRRGGRPAALLRIARRFPKAEPPLRQALEILL